MGKRAHDRVAGVHSRVAEAEAAHWLATRSIRPCALTRDCPCV